MAKNLATVTARWLTWRFLKKFDEGFDTYIVVKHTILNVKDIRRRGQNPEADTFYFRNQANPSQAPSALFTIKLVLIQCAVLSAVRVKR